MNDTPSGSFTTRKRQLKENKTIIWGDGSNENTESWEQSIASSTDVTITDKGDVKSGSIVPDSEADDKLKHRWYLSNDSPPFTDQVGSADSTSVTGTTQVTGDYVNGAARSANGNGDLIKTTTWGNFGSNMNTDFAIAFSISPFGEGTILGVENSNGEMTLTVRTDDAFGGALGTLTCAMRGDRRTGNSSVESSTDLTSGGPYRVVFNKRTNNESSWEIWINQSDDTGSVNRTGFDEQYVVDFNEKVSFFGYNNAGNAVGDLDAVLDDFCVFTDSLTQSEIQSYNNPWE